MTAAGPAGRAQQPWHGPLAEAMAEALPRLYGVAPDPLLSELIRALTSALERGGLELDLTGPPPDGVSAAAWPAGHGAALERSGLAAVSSDPADPPAPLVATATGGIAWRRWYEQQESVLAALQERALAPRLELVAAAAQSQVAADISLRNGLDPQQQRALQALLQHQLVVLGGGPGTGKTSTVVAMLAAVISLNPGLRTWLAAPTGKASSRLKRAIEDRCAVLPESLALALRALPCSTLHRLLESNGERFGRNRNHPLAIDLLVVDEASMLDLNLATALLDALPPQAQLLLVGDPAQLPPVGAGAILSELHRPERWQQLGEAAVELGTTYRNAGAIAGVASLLRHGDRSAVLERLDRLSPADNLSWLRSPTLRLPLELEKRMLEQQRELRRLAEGFSLDDPHTADVLLQQLEAFMVLSPLRRGPWGVEELNRRLLGERFNGGPSRWPPGTPVICTRNQEEADLANGDVGVVVQPSGGVVLFAAADGRTPAEPKLIHPARLEAAAAAFALTIHKAQGSEYETVCLLMPVTQHPDPRSLYTGLTRARDRCVLITPEGTDWLPGG
ncbi:MULTISPECIES: AAA family ATPase [unclassified Synechococcus]|uniref:AAA family ATPase n=1 Tax=unclassified Synechococcus TaxID=2626047 RepID=UPI0021A82302|nr:MULTISPECIES: AAA family ATPase [unclassified Synechococcus]MCT0214265.1 AAA family ATPase [Synechococcus sp. CS-1326]MCT0234429.1 AAA family ATPase [Synechococcus sp. CS-1327]